jgi:hypothetical protein
MEGHCFLPVCSIYNGRRHYTYTLHMPIAHHHHLNNNKSTPHHNTN